MHLVLSHITFTYLVLVGHKRTHTTVLKEYLDPLSMSNLSWAGRVICKGDILIYYCGLLLSPAILIPRARVFKRLIAL